MTGKSEEWEKVRQSCHSDLSYYIPDTEPRVENTFPYFFVPAIAASLLLVFLKSFLSRCSGIHFL